MRRSWRTFLTAARQCTRDFTSTAVHYETRRPYVHFTRQTRGSGQSRAILVIGAGSIGALAYYQSLQEVPFTHRRHSIRVSADMEKSLGEGGYDKIKEQNKDKILPAWHPAAQKVRKIGLQVVKSALEGRGGGFQDHMRGLDWEFIVIERSDPNAMVLPGGKVVVHTGLLDIIRSDDELAAVLGHETAHVLARHVAEKISQQQLFELLRVLLFWMVGIPVPAAAAELAIYLPNSRRLETEADVIGMQIAAQSCYDPSASVSVFEKLGQYESRISTPGFLRTHPITEERLKFVRAALPEAGKTFQSKECGRWTSAFAHSGFPRYG